jgi:predicted metalloprotease
LGFIFLWFWVGCFFLWGSVSCCRAGVWAATVNAEGALEPGDLDEAFNAAEAVGDDRLQRQATGSVDPDSFTHGTSEQRRSWFERGYRSGDPGDCDTFSAESL